MQIKIIASGSTGNCAILKDKIGSQIILDCGVNLNKVLIELDWSKPIICLISHRHGDHYNAKSIDKLRMCGVNILSEDDFVAKNKFSFNGFNIVAIRLPHCKECDSWAFLMYNTIEKKSFFFATDCRELPNIVDTKINLMMIENNYDKKTVFANNAKGKITNIGYLNHLSAEDVLSWLQPRKNKPDNLILSHLSNSGNIFLEGLLDMYKSQAGVVYLAKENLLVEF